MTSVLETKGLTVRYGGVLAVNDVDIVVRPDSLVGLIGPNGAGKTSFIDALTGYTPTSGTIHFLGREIQRHSTHERVREGLTRTFQALELFEDLTVRANVAAARQDLRWYSFLSDLIVGARRPRALEEVDETLELLGLSDSAAKYPNEMSLGQRKLVAVARAVATEPKLLLLDEPAAGLDSGESLELGKTLRAMVSPERAMLLVDHDMGLVLTVCDYIYVLDFGKVIAAGTAAEIRSDPRVISAYLGDQRSEPSAEGANGTEG